MGECYIMQIISQFFKKKSGKELGLSKWQLFLPKKKKFFLKSTETEHLGQTESLKC